MGFPAIEIAGESKIALRPLVGLQVWLHGRQQASEWVMTMAARAVAVEPEGLYCHWAGLKPSETGHIILPNPQTSFLAEGLDLYDLVRVDGPLLSDEAAEGAGRQLTRTIEQLLASVPKKEPAPAVEKPWWEEE